MMLTKVAVTPKIRVSTVWVEFEDIGEVGAIGSTEVAVVSSWRIETSQ